MICLPIVIAPFRIAQSLSFVHDIENRTPNSFPHLQSASSIIDAAWWSGVSRAIEDRVPFRKQMVTAKRVVFPARSGDHISDKVELGKPGWLFFKKSLAEDLGTLEETHQAIDAIESFIAENTFKAELFIVVAPNKVSIYPEMLTEESQAKYATSLEQRELLYGYFAKPDAPYLIDVWTPTFALKAVSDELIYEPAGSHYNSLGAMVLARAMIDAVDPSLWDDSQRTIEWEETLVPDIAKLVGDWDMTEDQTRVQIHRPGIEIVELWETEHKKGVTADTPKRVDNPDYLTINKVSYYNPRHVVNRPIAGPNAEPLIPGKTLILFDSFIGHYLHPTLSQFFEEVDLIHIGTVDQAFFKEALDTYDRVYFQTAERHIIRRAIEFFGS